MPMVNMVTTNVLSHEAYEAAMMKAAGPKEAIVVPSFRTLVRDMMPLVIIRSASQDDAVLQNHMTR